MSVEKIKRKYTEILESACATTLRENPTADICDMVRDISKDCERAVKHFKQCGEESDPHIYVHKRHVQKFADAPSKLVTDVFDFLKKTDNRSYAFEVNEDFANAWTYVIKHFYHNGEWPARDTKIVYNALAFVSCRLVKLGQPDENLTGLSLTFKNPALKKLTIMSNPGLVYLGANCLACCPNLIKLTLTSNMLGNLDPKCFSGLGNLKFLDLSENCLTSVPNFELPNLKVLNLQKNKLVRLSSRGLSNCPRLHRLFLNHNLNMTLEADCFGGLDQLKILYLQNTHDQILPDADEPPATYEKWFPSRRILFVARAALAQYGSLPALQTLGLSRTFSQTAPQYSWTHYQSTKAAPAEHVRVYLMLYDRDS